MTARGSRWQVGSCYFRLNVLLLSGKSADAQVCYVALISSNGEESRVRILQAWLDQATFLAVSQ
jgi:hypothetical protein